MSDEPDTYWLSLMKAGEHDAVRVLWERYFRRLMALARNRLQNVPCRMSDEQDVALSAFHSFCRGAASNQFDKLDDREDLWKILSVITVRKAVRQIVRDSAKKRGGGRVRGESALDFENACDDQGGGLDNVVIDSAATPEMMALIEERFHQLLSGLPQPDLETVALLKLEGFSNAEIAEQLGRHERSIERKLKLIRKHWTKLGED